MLTVFEELFWGDAGIALSILGTGLAAASLAATGTPEQMGEWLPQMFGTVDEPLLGVVLRIRARRRIGRRRHHHPRQVRRGQRRMGDQRHQDLGHQRRHRQRAHRRRLGATPSWAPAVRPRSSSRRAPRVSARARSSRSTASAPRTPPRSSSTTSASPAGLIIGGKDKFDERIARVREGKSSAGQAAMKTFETHPPHRRRDGARRGHAPPTSTPSSTPSEREQFGRKIGDFQAIAFKLADMKTQDRRRAPAGLAGRLDGPQRQAVRQRRGLDGQARGQRDRGLRHRRGHPDPRRQRLHPRLPRRAHAPRRQDLHDLRGHQSEIQRLVMARAITGLPVR